MRRLALTLCAAVLALAVPASAQMGHDMGGDAPSDDVSILVSAYTPEHLDVLVGDTVRWSNDSIRAHTVTADAGAWSSDRLLASDTYARRFDAPGVEPYYCKLHAFMRGEVDVHRVLLTAPKEPGAPGRPYALHGRAALPQGSTVTIEADTGAGFEPAAHATVGAGGAFSVDVAPRASTSYRAVAGGETSPAVQLLVLDRKVRAAQRTRGRAVSVSVGVEPASPGATVVLQLRLKQHFGWWPVARAKVDHHSRARFALRLKHRYAARVVLTLADGATQLAVSRTFHVGR